MRMKHYSVAFLEGAEMAGLLNIFGPNKILNSLEEHSNCYVVVDGSNLQYHFSRRGHRLSNIPAYERSVRNFFKLLLDAKITPHVFFDGPSRGDPHKWVRSKRRRQERLDKLIYRITSFEGVFEYPQPTAIQDIFRDVIESLGIRSIQVSANRDYLLEIISHAKHFDAFLISGNTKFFIEDIPRGFVCPQRNFFADFEYSSKCVMTTFHYKRLRQLIGLERSRNPFALVMWVVVLFNSDIFGLFSKPFLVKEGRPPHYPKSRRSWMDSILSDKCRKFGHLKLLQFFLENAQADAEEIVKSQLYPDRREEASLLFAQSIAAYLIEPEDVFQKIERQIETDTFCDEDLPTWFLRYLTVECKVIPNLMDVLTDRRHHLMTLLEDYDKLSVNKTTLRLRRIAYGILFADREEGDGAVKVLELDRVGDKLEENQQTPIAYVWDPESGSEPEEVPGLRNMDSLPQSSRAELFLLSMGISKNSLQGIKSNPTLYVSTILRYWIVANSDIQKADLLRILLTVLLVEQEYSKSSHVFAKTVKLHEDAASKLEIRFDADSVSDTHDSFACMHPLALLQNVTLFGRILHRLFMQPLGATIDSIETITSEVAFFHVSQNTEHMDVEELEEFILEHMDEKSGKNFTETVDVIWDEGALRAGELIVRGYRGDDKRH